ncbi:MFS transporter [Dactylosporangium sp. NBC_01737]|uniref:MFS transporter n=1 Tax=Dactylosporangium sp. NBC_01737 TaxID=2975959 RepID=UPI002E111488|nr:MFS transporter [Dactylosporangium sp. NBC_01737]
MAADTAVQHRRATAVVALACTAQFVDVVGVTVLIVALPMIQHDLGLGDATLSWVAGIYALAFGGFLVPGGRAADLAGRRTTFMLGSALVAGGSLLCALAGSGAVLLAGRAAQGLGAAVAVPAALAILLDAVPPGPRRNRALGLWTMAGAAGGASGFVIGGLITQAAGWRWLFAAIGPVALLAAVVTPLVVRSGPPRTRPAGNRLDLPGIVLSTTAVVLVILGFTRAQDHGFLDPFALVPLALAPLAGSAFVVVQRRSPAPLVPAAVWSARPFRLGTMVAVVLTATTSGAGVLGSLFLQHGLGLSAAASGTGFLLFSAGVVVSSTTAAAAIRRVGLPGAMATGLAVIAAAMTVEAAGVWHRSLPLFLAGLTVSGLGLGLASVASTTCATADTAGTTAGLVGGLLNAAAQIGTAVGIAVLLAIAPPTHATAYLAAAGAALAAGLLVRLTRARG